MTPSVLELASYVCVVMGNILFFVRRAIIRAHGYRTSYMLGLSRDWRPLSEIAEKEPSVLLKRLYRALNISIAVLFGTLLVLFICMVFLEMPR